MRRMLLALAITAGAVGGMTSAHHGEHDKGGDYARCSPRMKSPRR
jgi:hypothetical protein